jgi:hypothetical protein
MRLTKYGRSILAAVVGFLCVEHVTIHAETLKVSVNYKNFEGVVFNAKHGQPDLLRTFYVSAHPRSGQPDEQQLTRSGQAEFEMDPQDVIALSWRTVENRGFVLWPYRDSGPLPANYTKFRLKPLNDVFVEARDRAVEQIDRGNFKPAEEDFEILKQMFQALPVMASGPDRRQEFHTSLLRTLCNAALRYRNTHRIRKGMVDNDALERADTEADWIWELVWDVSDQEEQADLGQLAGALLLWETFARDTYLLDRRDWPRKNGDKTPAFRNDAYRQRLTAQIEAIQNVLNREAIASAATRELQKIPSKKIRFQQLKLWQSGVLDISASKVAFRNLSALINGMYKYCRGKGANHS